MTSKQNKPNKHTQGNSKPQFTHSVVIKNNNTLTQKYFSLNTVTLFYNLSSHTLSPHLLFLH